VTRWSDGEYELFLKNRPKPITEAIKKWLEPEPTPKYHNEPTIADGIRFASIAEARRNQELQLMLKSGEIKWYNRQPSFVIGRANGRDLRYRPDFIVCGCIGVIWVEDVKGFETKDWKLKAAMFREKYPDLELVIVK